MCNGRCLPLPQRKARYVLYLRLCIVRIGILHGFLAHAYCHDFVTLNTNETMNGISY
jgi:hypothetical protein